MGIALAVVKTLEGKKHDLEAFRHRVTQIKQTGDVGLIDLARRIMGAAGVHVEQALGVVQRMEHRRQLRPDDDATATIANAGQMNMAIPELSRIDAGPHLLQPRAVDQPGRDGDPTFVDQQRLGRHPTSCRQGDATGEQPDKTAAGTIDIERAHLLLFTNHEHR